jgi:hypothetical protein
MRRLLISSAFALLLATTLPASAATGKVVKVLPHFLDLKGRHSLSPSLYDRDAYQVQLRQHPEQRSGLRFDVQWRARDVKDKLKLKAELRGTAKGDLPRSTTLESEIPPGRKTSGWASLQLAGEDYKSFGEVTAWRVTLWDGEKLVGEQKSFLW